MGLVLRKKEGLLTSVTRSKMRDPSVFIQFRFYSLVKLFSRETYS